MVWLLKTKTESYSLCPIYQILVKVISLINSYVQYAKYVCNFQTIDDSPGTRPAGAAGSPLASRKDVS